ncbi:AMP-binding protein [Poseidonibacter antarcticus]|uniref:AMP-binding protein n=1 Tax=Poseidonibacter antarcticus TaxID=2478538 RepID=UPI000EF557F8|nr:class I adenylate-forming enzyme family protein [Poseidonibacter antarcticus]
MNSILDYIADIPSSRVAFVTKDDSFTYKDIFDLYISNKEIIDTLSNSCVVVNARDRYEFSKLLSILDGKVKRIVFLPEDIETSLIERYYTESKATYEVFLENNILKLNEIDKNNILENIYETQWVVPTSGTTNNPKLISHTFESLTKTSKKNIELGSKYIWGLTFDIYRFSGIQVFLQALSGGSSIIIPESNYSMKETIELFVQNKSNIISATPSFWRKVLMTKESDNLSLKRATLGGEISDQSILTALKNKFRDVKLTHIYASTEVGVGFAVTDEKAGFPLEYIENGIGDIKLKVDNNSLLWINPGTKIQNYIAKESMYSDDGFINTGDLVKIENNRVYFSGRESGSINVGGNKVQPEEIEATLLNSNLVQTTYVYAKNNPMMGSLVCADVIPKDSEIDKTVLKKQILEYCRKNLENFKIPVLLKIVNDIEITQSGKIKRK